MTNPLTSLDELIWKQFEKVTQYAHKSYGWDKWDLVDITNAATITAQAGMGIYLAMMAFVEEKPYLQSYFGMMGGLTMLVGAVTSPFYKVLNKFRQEREFKIVTTTGAFPPPSYSPLRPAILGAAGMPAGYAMYTLGQEGFTSFDILLGLLWGCSSLSLASSVFSGYFSSQLPTPPSTKKPFWRTTYEMIRNKFKPKPQLEPAAEPASQYATIDTLIA